MDNQELIDLRKLVIEVESVAYKDIPRIFTKVRSWSEQHNSWLVRALADQAINIKQKDELSLKVGAVDKAGTSFGSKKDGGRHAKER